MTRNRYMFRDRQSAELAYQHASNREHVLARFLAAAMGQPIPGQHPLAQEHPRWYDAGDGWKLGAIYTRSGINLLAAGDGNLYPIEDEGEAQALLTGTQDALAGAIRQALDDFNAWAREAVKEAA